MANRLAGSLSPYLLQHKDNPIDWYPWSDEAWNRSKTEGKPVFLSIGYSSCHWCHVMAHESFEDEEIARALNDNFVCIKLDREERPDIDETFMTAVQLATGHGGWPMSLFLTPDRMPFFVGTYFPKEARAGHPGFLTVVNALAKAWREENNQIQKSAEDFNRALSAALERSLPSDQSHISVDLLDRAVEAMHQDFDFEHGGFGNRPKFPPHASIRFLLDYAGIRPELGGEFSDLPGQAAHMALLTLEQIALGGIHDHIGGGFHRYSTDERWLLPHFEKMLYDNAQLLSSFRHAAVVVDERRLASLFNRVADRCASWILTDLRTDDGLFMTALDADSDGKEGAYYVWLKPEIEKLLGEESVGFCDAFGVRPEGNFYDEATGLLTGDNVLHLLEDPGSEWDSALETLAVHRRLRVAPMRDYKAVAAWNGLAISALASAGKIKEAAACARVWCDFGSTLPHMVTNREATGLAFLDDVAFMADGLLDLGDATQDPQWNESAHALAELILAEFVDEQGGMFYVRRSEEVLVARTQPYMDNATPSPIGVATRVLRRTGHASAAAAALQSGLGWIQSASRAADTLLRESLMFLWNTDGLATEPPMRVASDSVVVELQPAVVTVDSDGWGYSEIVITVPPDMHVNSHEPNATWLTPTTLEVEGAFAEAAFPESIDGTYRGETRVPLRLRKKAADGEFEINVRYQACTDHECFLPIASRLNGRLVEG